MLKHQRLFVRPALFLVCLFAVGLTAVSAAGDPEIRLTSGGENDSETTMILSLQNIPSDQRVEYAQIELTCDTEAFDIVADSFGMETEPDRIKTSVKQDTAEDSLLLLIEPEDNTFVGLSNGDVCRFTVQNKTGEDTQPAFTLDAILILKDGTEYAWSTSLSPDLSGGGLYWLFWAIPLLVVVCILVVILLLRIRKKRASQ